MEKEEIIENESSEEFDDEDEEDEFEVDEKFNIARIIIGIVSVIILLIAEIFMQKQNFDQIVDYIVILPCSLIIYAFNGFDTFINAFNCLKKKDFINEITFTIIATIAAFAIGQFIEAAAIMVFFQIGELFEHYANNKSKNSIKNVLELRPDSINLYNNGEITQVKVEEAKLDDLFIVKPGERVPLDGIIVEGSSSLDYSSMTGESVPLTKTINDEILSGVINLSSPIILKVTKTNNESTVTKILKVVKEATSSKAKSEKFITKFVKVYSPTVLALAFIVAIIPPLFLGISDGAVWRSWINVGASFLVIACPCSMLLSVPLSYFIGIGKASEYKILIKSSNYVELLSKATTVVFDKTGTITNGKFSIHEIYPANNYSKNDVLLLAGYGEYYSNHPIASAIKEKLTEQIDENLINNYQNIDGKGVSLLYKNKSLLVGNDKLLKDNNISFEQSSKVGTLIYVAYDNVYVGLIIIKDTLKPTSREAIENLYKVGIKKTVMLTGDSKQIANDIASECKITNVYSELLPLDKTEILDKLIATQNKKETTVFVGDGVNDSPSLAKANIGISMGNIGSDAAVEASNIIIMDDDLKRISEAKKISKTTVWVAIENIVISLFVKFSIMIVSVLNSAINLGINDLIMWFAIFGDVGVLIICVVNSIRIMWKNYHLK